MWDLSKSHVPRRDAGAHVHPQHARLSLHTAQRCPTVSRVSGRFLMRATFGRLHPRLHVQPSASIPRRPQPSNSGALAPCTSAAAQGFFVPCVKTTKAIAFAPECRCRHVFGALGIFVKSHVYLWFQAYHIHLGLRPAGCF